MPQCVVTVPEAWLQDILPSWDAIRSSHSAVEAATRDRLVSALRLGLGHVEDRVADDGPKVRLVLRLADADDAILRERAGKAGLTAGPFAKWLLCGVRAQKPGQIEDDSSDPVAELNRLIGQMDASVTTRPEQSQFAANLRDALAGGRIGMVEGGTGIGKTRAMVVTANDWALANNGRIAIAAPTLALVRQLAAEHALQSRIREVPPLRLVFGRREFVSESDLALLLAMRASEVDPDGKVSTWVKAGAPASPQSVAMGVDASWLVSTLEYVIPDFPVDEVRLADGVPGPKDRGLMAYMAQFADDDQSGAEVVLCSHAMLAQDMRKRQFAARRVEEFVEVDRELAELLRSFAGRDAVGRLVFRDQKAEIDVRRVKQFKNASADRGVLPDFLALIVDEAHMLEQICSTSLTRYLALRSIGRHMREFRQAGGHITLKLIEEVESCVGGICTLARSIDRDMAHLGTDIGPVSESARYLAQIARCLEKVPMPQATASIERRRAAIQIRQALLILRAATGKAGSASYLRFSPKRAYPQLYIGSRSVETMLRTMWASLEAGAAVSATLYLDGSSGPSASYQRMLLGIPEDRCAEYPPVHCSWTREPVRELWTAGELGTLLRPPPTHRLNEDDVEQAEQEWLGSLAPVLARIHETSAGGTLVLMTSYRSIRLLVSLMHELEPVIVEARLDFPVLRQMESFLRRRRMGLKPLWLAVGGAWTGLDAGGHDPWTALFGERIAAADDNVLCDLVIPRLPYGTNHSISHQWRVHNRPSVSWDLLDTAFRFRQGLGRPVRRDGLPRNRRFWILDGRLSEVAAGSRYSVFEKLIARYPVKTLPADWKSAIVAAPGGAAGPKTGGPSGLPLSAPETIGA